MSVICFDSPVGLITVTAQNGAITGVDIGRPFEGAQEACALLECARAQLTAYFDGRLRAFDLPLSYAGTAFQRAVWDALLTIPYGQVRAYGDIARQIGVPGGARAVGMANHNNPLPILVPCHRVVAAHGAPGGYGYGLDVKRALLRIEGVTI